jgi:hypothetical protein
MLCEENMTTTEARSALSIPQNNKHATLAKTQSNIRNIDKYCTKYGMTNHNVKTCRKKKEWTTMATKRQHNQIKNHKRHLHMHATFVV